MRQQIQKFGRALSGMVMPNIGAFIAWGFVTALFIPSGWWPNTQMARLVDPMLTYLLPLLIAYTAGRNVAGERGGVIGAIAAMGVIVGSDIPMFIGAMVMGPLGGYTIRWFDKLTQGRIKAGFEMLVSNFSIGILGMLLAILGYWVIGGAVTGLTLLVSNGVEVVIRHGLLPLVSLLVEPSKVLFLNNALNHGIFSPIGIEQARETGQSIMFLLETNPGPGLGVLLACWFFGRGNMRQSAPGAVIIQFCGGIHAQSTGRIGMFKIISESSVAAGIRRIEAKTGKECEELMYNIEDVLKAIRGLFNNAKDLQGVIGKYIEEHDAMKKSIEQFQAAAVERTKNDLIAKAREVNGVKVITAVLPLEPAAAKDLMFKLRQAVPSNLLAVVGSVAHEKPMLNVCMSDDLVKDHSLNAGQMVREAAKLIQGGGGGQPHFAQAGGKNVDGLSAAVDKVVELAQL